MALIPQYQESFDAGAFPGLDVVPSNGLEDVVNGILETDGSVSRRGGARYLGTFSGVGSSGLINLWSGDLPLAGGVTVASRSESGSESVYYMLDSQSDFTLFSTGEHLGSQRFVTFAGMLVAVNNAGTGDGANVLAWPGVPTAVGGSFTVTVTNGSPTVTGTGLPATLAGTVLTGIDGDRVGVVASRIDSSTLRLIAPWKGPTQTAAANFAPSVLLQIGEDPLPAVLPGVTENVPYLASLFDRLIIGRGTRVAFTSTDDPFVVSGTDYHELPAGAVVRGLEPLRDQMLVFSSRGVYAIGGLSFDLTDALGNVQQRLEHVMPDLVLWDNRGIASWQGAVIAPALDDIYLVESASSRKAIGGGIRDLYRSYVQAGYQAGQAAVYQSRYVLPILNGTGWVDTLICDLRTGGWVRWNGYGGAVRAATVKIGQGREPQIFALGTQGNPSRILELTECFAPDTANKDDPDGSQHALRLETRTFQGGYWWRRRWQPDLFKHQWRRVRLRAEVTGDATPDDSVRASYELGRVGSEPVVLGDPLVREGS